MSVKDYLAQIQAKEEEMIMKVRQGSPVKPKSERRSKSQRKADKDKQDEPALGDKSETDGYDDDFEKD
jgi:hypothetical protein